MDKKTLRDIDVAGKRALVRVDFNVPLDDEQHITDDTRIVAALPTIQALLDGGASVVLMSHLGRPDGKVVEKLRMAPIAQRLSELLHRPVQTASDSIGPEVEAQANALQAGQVLLLENLRFHKEEEKNDPAFAQRQRCLWHSPSCSCLNRGCSTRVTRSGWLFDGKGTELSWFHAGKPEASIRSYHRWSESFRQNRCPGTTHRTC